MWIVLELGFFPVMGSSNAKNCGCYIPVMYNIVPYSNRPLVSMLQLTLSHRCWRSPLYDGRIARVALAM